ncbi:MAG: hypothetical protein ACRELF_00040 [Gemmataceae bacterium]
MAADPEATNLLGFDKRAAQATKAVEDDLVGLGQGFDQERHLLDRLRAGVGGQRGQGIELDQLVVITPACKMIKFQLGLHIAPKG